MLKPFINEQKLFIIKHKLTVIPCSLYIHYYEINIYILYKTRPVFKGFYCFFFTKKKSSTALLHVCFLVRRRFVLQQL